MVESQQEQIEKPGSSCGHKPATAVNTKDLSLTNDEFFKNNSCMYFTDEVEVKLLDQIKLVNEFVVLENIGRGSYSKVKRVIRQDTNPNGTPLEAAQQLIARDAAEQQEEAQVEGQDDVSKQAGTNNGNNNNNGIAEFAMKIVHKPTLRRERAIRYDYQGEMQMINNLDKVYNEIEVWTQLSHPYITKIYEMIDDDSHDYLYLVLELADAGQIATWNFKNEKYERNPLVYQFVLDYLRMHNGLKEDQPEVEQVACYLFRQLIAATMHLHDRMGVIHRDIKPENILFSSHTAEIKLTDFTCSRNNIEEGVRLFDSEGTPCFTAPECHVVEPQGYAPKPTDIWSLGVCLFAYVTDGRLPFYGQSELEIQIASRQNDLEVPETCSDQLKDLLNCVMKKDPNDRPNAQQMLAHPFFATE